MSATTETILLSLALSLILTLVFEAGFFLLVGKRNKKDLLLLVLVNVVTNPIVVLSDWLVVLYTSWDIRIVLLFLETFAVLTEGFCYKKYGKDFKRPLLFALAANAFSFTVGALIQLVL